jgi:hypothetical protein
LVVKHERKRPLGTLRGRWEVNVKLNALETEWKVMDWINVCQDTDHWWARVNKARS